MNFNTIKIAPVASAASKVESHTTRYFPDRTTIINYYNSANYFFDSNVCIYFS